MTYRNLRIAWSICCGIACALLIVLWVRSYWGCDIFSWNRFSVESERGVLYMVAAEAPPGFVDSDAVSGWTVADLSEADDVGSIASMMTISASRQKIIETMEAPGMRVVAVKLYALLLVSIGLAIIPASRLRFSTRTLLVATTLVAMLLGLIVWAANR